MLNSAGDEHQREEARHDEVLDGSTPSTCSASSSSRILRAPRSAVIAVPATPGEHDRGHVRADLADRGEHEDPAEAVQRAEERQEVRRLQARGGVADAHRRDQQRKPAQPQREQELRRRTRRRTGRAGAAQTRSSCPSGSSCPRLPRAGSSSGGTPARLHCEPSSACPSSGDDRYGTATLRDALAARHPALGRHARSSRAPPLVSWPRCEGESSPSWSLLAQRLALAALCSPAVAAASAPGRARTERDLHRRRSSRLASRPCRRSRARAALELAVRNTEHAHDAERRGHDRLVRLHQHYPELASSKRPIWVVEQGPGTIPKRPVQSQEISPPGGGQTAYVNTWALGPLAPGRHADVPLARRPGQAGAPHGPLHDRRRPRRQGPGARLADGAIRHGHFTVEIAPRPPATHVNPTTGQVVPGRYEPGTSVAGG